MRRGSHLYLWFAISVVVAIPVLVAAMSPLLGWREPVYVLAGFAGILALGLLLVQLCLISGYLPGFAGIKAQRLHRWGGFLLLLAVVTHVVGLWFTSPPDVLDALLFSSPTPFSHWGVLGMWVVIATSCWVVFRSRLPVRASTWRLCHRCMAAVIVVTSVVHALLIEGTMGLISKWMLCGVILFVSVWVLARRWPRKNTTTKSEP